ncbi:OmpA family protein [Nocardiopsis composta]
MRPSLCQAGALVVSIALLVGLPYAAATLPTAPSAGWDAVTAWAYLRGGTLPPGSGTLLLMIGLWGAWGLYVLALGAEVAARLAGRAPRRRLLGPLQVMAATAIGATLSAPAAHAAAPASSAEAVSTPQPEDTGSRTTGGEQGGEEEPGAPQAGESENGLVERTRTLDGFGHDSAELPEEAQADLDPVVQMIAGHAAAGVPVVVTGHTDATGDPDYNQELSQRRAEAVAEQLRTRLGEAAPPIQARGLGSAAPLQEADPEDAAQRRVEIAYTVTTTPPPQSPPSETEKEEPPPADAAPEGTEERSVIVVEVPSAAGVAGAAVAAGAAGFWAGRRGRPASRREDGHDDPDHTTEPEPEAGREGEPEGPVSGGDPGPGWRHDLDLPHTPEHHEEPEPEDEPASETAAPPPPGKRVEVARLRGAVGLTGAGAAGAARTALAAAHHPGLHVIIPAPDLEHLLGAEAAHRIRETTASAVTITGDLEQATARLHTEMLTRLDELDDEEGGERPLLAPDDPEEAVLLIAAADHDAAERIEVLLAGAGAAPVAALLLSNWPERVVAVDHSGTVTGGDGDITPIRGLAWPPATRGHVLDALLTPPPQEPQPALGSAVEEEPADAPEDTGPQHTEETEGPASEEQDEKTAEPPVRLQVLGRITLKIHGRTLAPRRRAAHEAAAYLTLHPDGVRLDRAVEEMWPGEPATRATRRFHDAVSALRAAIRGALPTDSSPAVVLREDDYYRLDPATLRTDLADLHTALETGTPKPCCAPPGPMRISRPRPATPGPNRTATASANASPTPCWTPPKTPPPISPGRCCSTRYASPPRRAGPPHPHRPFGQPGRHQSRRNRLC